MQFGKVSTNMFILTNMHVYKTHQCAKASQYFCKWTSLLHC